MLFAKSPKSRRRLWRPDRAVAGSSVRSGQKIDGSLRAGKFLADLEQTLPFGSMDRNTRRKHKGTAGLGIQMNFEPHVR
jgi:hypothetical protein